MRDVARLTKNGLHQKDEPVEKESEPRYLSLMADDLENLIGLARRQSLSQADLLVAFESSSASLRRRAELFRKHLHK